MAGDCGSTCPASDGFYTYSPSVGGNAVLLTVFALLALVALYFGVRSKTYLFSFALTAGLFLEVLGFIGRILLHSKQDDQGHFFLVLFGTVLGPSLMSVAIFIVLPHILGIYGKPICPFRPLVAGLIFWGLAAVTIIFELVGIIFTAYETNGFSVCYSNYDHQLSSCAKVQPAKARSSDCCHRLSDTGFIIDSMHRPALLVHTQLEYPARHSRCPTFADLLVLAVQEIPHG